MYSFLAPKGTFEKISNRSRVVRYIPTIGKPDWNIHELTREDRSKIKENIKVGITTSEEEYKAVIAYMYIKFPDLFDFTTENNLSIQWKYSTHRNKSNVPANDALKEVIAKNKANRVDMGKDIDELDYQDDTFDMYALVYYDTSRDNEPVLFGGSYFKEVAATPDVSEECLRDGGKSMFRCQGYVLHTDFNYRRMGLALDSWITEGELCRNHVIPKNYEIQNSDSLRVTQRMFSDPAKCKIVAPGRLKADGTRSGIRVLLDYTDPELVDRFNGIEENMQDFYQPMDWSFLEREGLTIEELNKFWDK